MESTVKALTEGDGEFKPKAVALADELADRKEITPALIVKTLREGEVALFAALFGRYTGIRLQLVQRMLFEPGGEGLAIACKGSGIDKSTFASIYVLTRKARGRDSVNHLADMAGILGLFDRIKEDAAGMLLKKWQRDPNFLRAIWQIEQPQRTTTRH
jgi:hypothetical protein